jgi:formate-dependent nitrite reductase membrane component NrfD
MSAQPSWRADAPSDYARGEIPHWPGWRGLIGWDVFLNNLTAGITVVMVLAWWLVPEARVVAAPVLTIAWLVLMADLLVLVSDLGDPWRFHHMLRTFKRVSPMSVGVWALSSYAALLTLAVVAAWLPVPLAQAAARWIATLAALPALVVLGYKGVLLSCTSQPGLRDARWLSAYLAASGLMMGAAVLILAAGVLEVPLRSALRAAFVALILVSALALLLLHGNVSARARERYSSGTRQAIVLVGAVGGLILPLLLALVQPGRASLEGAALLALFGGLVVRHALVRLAEPVQ